MSKKLGNYSVTARIVAIVSTEVLAKDLSEATEKGNSLGWDDFFSCDGDLYDYALANCWCCRRQTMEYR